MAPVTKADTINLKQKEIVRYSDFSDNFEMNPFTCMLARVTNEESVKQALKNLVLTNCGERFYDSHKGSKVRQSLFELVSIGALDVMKIQLQQALNFYEPRATIIDIQTAQSRLDANTLEVKIIFSVINIPDKNFSLTLNVQRVR